MKVLGKKHKHFRNIEAKLGHKPGWKDADDLTSIQLRFDEQNDDDGFRVYCPPTNQAGTGLKIGSSDIFSFNSLI